MKDSELQKLVKHLLLLGDNDRLKEIITLRKKSIDTQYK